jgi:FAD/FMN-containing dehydrogenase
MNISMEQLVNMVVAAVLKELTKRGIRVETGAARTGNTPSLSPQPQIARVINMSEFRSPVLLERHLRTLAPETREIVVPPGTVVTPGAKDIIRKKNLTLKHTSTTN